MSPIGKLPEAEVNDYALTQPVAPSEPGPAGTPADLRRSADDEAGRDEALQDDRPARPPPRGLHHAPPAAG